MRDCIRILLLMELLVGFLLLFLWIRRGSILRSLWRRAYDSLEMAAARRVQDNRRSLQALSAKKNFWQRMEQRLIYSGISRYFPFLTPELWVLAHLALAAAAYFLALLLGATWLAALLAGPALWLLINLAVNVCMGRNYNATDENLMKFLDFLGNYSITSGEITAVLSQVSPYVGEPLRSVLEACYYEAQTSGDTSIALLAMAEKLQHPKFQELVRNLEISLRYSADLTVMVAQSRRSLREYTRMRQERRSLVREAWVNIVILGAMVVVILKALEALVGIPLSRIMLHTLPGIGCLAVIGTILLLFYRQVRNLD
ncbi:MAG: type II secretion system F family protein [bacterium]|nr:type II secretion system F family protein [bacterium]MCM1373883.1 type II secretion system F family protein [Muribaculum sp.]